MRQVRRAGTLDLPLIITIDKVALSFPLSENLSLAVCFYLWTLCCSLLSRLFTFDLLLWSVSCGDLPVFLHTFCRIYDRGWENKVLRKGATQKVPVVETVGVDNPPGGVVDTMLDEALGGLRRFYAL